MAGATRIKLPDTIKSGDVIEIKALIQHVMETGNRKDAEGKPVPRSIIHTFRVSFEGQPVFAADWGSGISANPFVAFNLKVTGAGTLEFTWIDDADVTVVEKTPLLIS